MRLRLNHAVLFLQLLRNEWVLWVQVCHKLLEILHLELERLGSFEVLSLNRFFLALLEHVEVAANEFQLVSHVLQFDSRVKILLLYGHLLFALKNGQLLAQFRVQLLFIHTLNAQVTRLEHRVVLDRKLLRWVRVANSSILGLHLLLPLSLLRIQRISLGQLLYLVVTKLTA